MSSSFHNPKRRRRAYTLLLVIVVMAMTGMVAVLLSAHFTTMFRHVRTEADKARVRQLSASGLQWARQNRAQILADEKPVIHLPVPKGMSATLTVRRSDDKSACTVEAVVRRASHGTTHRRRLSLTP